MKIKRSILAPLVVALIALATGGWLLQQGTSQERNVYVQARLFEEVLHHISDRYVEETESSELYRMAIDGMLQELGDPHSVFMTPEDYAQLRIQTQGEYGGLGIEIAIRDDWVTVVAPLPGTPAERAGLQAGDRIITVDGTSTHGWSSQKAVTELRGPKGAPVDLGVARVGADEPIEFRVVRDEIEVHSIRSAYMMSDDIGYVQLTTFMETSADELRQAIDGLRAQGMQGLVLDLRDNPGGLLEQGIAISDLFLESGETVAETRSRLPRQNHAYDARDADHYPNLPLVVLVGRRTASASEILAGALQDHDRALILGERSFGKGSVQTLFPLPGGNYLKLTTARWYTPAGRSIQKPYGIDAERLAAAAGGEGESTAAAGAPNDTTAPDGERGDVFYTDAGREVYGGGGIHPDLIVHDTLSTAEQDFVEAVQTEFQEYRDVLYSYAIAYEHDRPQLAPDFAVTPELLDGFYQAMQERGLEVDRSLYDGASDWIGRDLARVVARAAWGAEGSRKRLNLRDRQVQVAADLLREAANPSALFGLAEQRADATGTFVGLSGAEQEAGTVRRP